MNTYDIDYLTDKMNDRAKINLVHKLICDLYATKDMHKDNFEILAYLDMLKKADDIFTSNNEFYI